MSRIALIGENSIEYVDILLDIWNNGDCAVLLDRQIPFESAYQMMAEADVTSCYIEKDLFDNINIPLDGVILFKTFDIAEHSARLLPQKIRIKYQENYSREEAVIFYSSGTTGKSKGIILTHFAISTNADAILEYMSLNELDCVYIAKILSHSSTLTGELLVALKAGAKLVIAPTIVPPRFVLNQIVRFNVTVLCLNPTLVRMYVEEYNRKQCATNSLKTIYISGDVLNDTIYAMAHEAFKNIDIFNVYGLSEAGPRVAAQTKECSTGNSVGRTIQGVEVVIVDNDGKRVKNLEMGIVHVNTPSIFSGYVIGTTKNRSLYLDWLNTGDIGFIDKCGELHIVCRADDVIVNNAHKIYPQDVEKMILKNCKVTDCAVADCFYNGEHVIGCIYVGKTELPQDIIRYLRKSLLPYEIPKRFVRVNSIPHNTRGKVDRREVNRILSMKD